jgi:ubiquinone biosynthesis protein
MDKARKLRLAFEELGPTFIKLGQMLSQRPDLLPHAYIMELEKLQDTVAPVSFEEMRKTFESECICIGLEQNPYCYHCRDILSIYDEFDVNPIASASLAQVYRAKINGEKVAIKVLRPKVIDLINLDLMIIYDLRKLLTKLFGFSKDFNFDEFIEEFRAMLKREIDYRLEALNAEKFRENFAGIEDVKVPKIYWKLSREKVLVMEYIEGRKIAEAMLDPSLNRKLIAEKIARNFLKQIYIDGFFHADPHPGNVWLVGKDKIAYLDFGAFGKIDTKLKEKIQLLFWAMYKRDVELAAEYFLSLGEYERVDIQKLKWDLDNIITKYHIKEAPQSRQSDSFVHLAREYDIKLPRIFSLFERALILTETMCLELDPDFHIMKLAAPLIEEIKQEKTSFANVKKEIEAQLPVYYSLLRDLPVQLLNILKKSSEAGIPVYMKGELFDVGKIPTQEILLSYLAIIALIAASAYLITLNISELVTHISFVIFGLGIALIIFRVLRR